MVLSLFLSESYYNNFLDTDIFKNPDIIMFENWQGISPMGLSASLVDCLKRMILHKHENFTKKLKMKHKKLQWIYPMGVFPPWSKYSFHNLTN